MRKLILFVIILSSITLRLISQNSKNIELDHFFIWTDDHLKYKELFVQMGFNMRSTRHFGQGSSSSSIFFSNFCLEFISIADEKEFETNNQNFKLLWKSAKIDREKNAGSPFGIGLHFKNNPGGEPFETFDYYQKWMRDSTVIKVANSTNTHLNEPYIFIVPDYLKWSLKEIDEERKERVLKYLKNKLNIDKLTDIEVFCPNCDTLSNSAGIVQNIEIIKFQKSDKHLVILTFDDYKNSKMIDFRPDLPLIIKY